MLGWTTGLVDLATRAGYVAQLQIADIDVVHIESGLGALVFVAWMMGARAGAGGRVVPRWLVIATALCYGAVGVTGVLALLPLSTLARDEVVDAHLLSAIVTVPVSIGVATAWWSSRRSRPSSGHLARVLTGSTLALCPAAIGFLAPRAVTPLAEAGAGSAWVPYGLSSYTDRIAVLPGTGRGVGAPEVIAAGAGLYVARIDSRPDGPLQIPAWRPVTGFPSSALVLGLLVAATAGSSGHRFLVGTVNGAFESPNAAGPYRRLPVHAGGVHAFAVEPDNPAVIWATSYAGPERSLDGGAHFTVEAAGMRSPGTSWAIAYVAPPRRAPVLLSTDENGVYRWDGSRWVEVVPERSVVSLDVVGTAVWSSSMGGGVELGSVRPGGEIDWRAREAGLEDRRSGPIVGIHVVSVTARPASDVMYAGTMLDGVAVSLDRGTTWSGVWEGLRRLGVVSRVVVLGDLLIAATDGGVYAYQLPPAPGASATWWMAVLAVGFAGSILGVAVLAGVLPGPRGRTRPGTATASKCPT